jgi:hypothetical protein
VNELESRLQAVNTAAAPGFLKTATGEILSIISSGETGELQERFISAVENTSLSDEERVIASYLLALSMFTGGLSSEAVGTGQ